MQNSSLIALSKLMSLMLRHEPAKFGLELDAEGFAPFDAVLAAVRTRLPQTSSADLITVVETLEPDKQRFTIVDDEIRANYGHSLTERIVQSVATPPSLLFHGTNERALAAIQRDGLKPMKRQYVHLTPDAELARRVGSRRGEPLLIEVDATAACAAGIVFYRANDNFWLVDALPAEYLKTKRAPEGARL